MEGKEGKTERATAKKREKEREEGNLCVSPEVTSMLVLFLGFVSLYLAVPGIWRHLTAYIMSITSFELVGEWNSAKLSLIFGDICRVFAMVMVPVLVPVIIGAVVANVAQTQPYFSVKALKWKLSELNPMKGIKRLFSFQSTTKLAISILKVALIATVIYLMTHKHLNTIMGLFCVPSAVSAIWSFKMVYKMTITVTVVFVLIAAMDWCFRKYRYEKGLMMTKQEVLEERKQEEPSALIKRVRMKRMRELSMMRMMAAVPNATVIITNPTHVAIALEYDPKTMDSPKVTAKGLRLVAQRIKRIAKENNIPIVERPVVARALYKHVKLGGFIPGRFYEAVAEILAYLHRIGKGVKI